MKLIMVFIDFAEGTSDLVTTAGQIARAMGGKLILMHIAMPNAEFEGEELRTNVSRSGIAAELRHRHRALEILELEMKKQNTDVTALMVRGMSKRGYPTAKIVDEVKRRNPDLIVLGSHRHGRLRRLLVGSVTDAVARKTVCPMLLLRSPQPIDHREKVAAKDHA